MSPLEFLHEEFENVRRALKETLRHDYMPERSKLYYEECVARLAGIQKAISNLATTDHLKIAGQLYELSSLANWISLVERSHLGEFSWPFAEELTRLARTLLIETDIAGNRLEPIIHVVAEGLGYRINYEPQVPSASGRHRFVIVAFPRSLKHHVLLHSIFGHELCHTAIYTTTAGGVIHASVVPALVATGPMASETAINTWLHVNFAPQEVKDLLADHLVNFGQPFLLFNYYREQWLVELICDLFGLLLFGPAFLAAHRALLRSTHSRPYSFDFGEPTHPPYALRHKMLVRAMQLLGWDKPVTTLADGVFNSTESELLSYVLDDPYDPWAVVLNDIQLGAAIDAIRNYFRSLPKTGYTPSDPATLCTLVDRVRNGIPPVIADIDMEGQPDLHEIDISQMLYAGWVFWLGRDHFPDRTPQDFLVTNRLCDLALLQQQAISMAIPPGEREWRSWAARP